ncbi:MAG: diguanylate cyclase [Alphaproteobacteria bacterium]|nr:diguanylate cyclase [Alphaproteobacteria bacterium]
MINMKNKVIISPPFGGHVSFKGANSVIGSLTLEKRRGAVWQFLKTFRKTEGGYINKIGLRNPGIDSLKRKNFSIFNDKILSIAVIDDTQWLGLAKRLKDFNLQGFSPLCVELNISCPNTDYKCRDILPIIAEFKPMFANMSFSVKLSPIVSSLGVIEQCLQNGIKIFHLSNTIPTEKGGISGSLLKEKSLSLIAKARDEFKKEITIIGGGGIYSKEDIDLYKQYGADIFSLSTVIVKYPLKVKSIITHANLYDM